MTQLPPRGDRAGVRRWSLWDGTRWVWSTRPLSPEHPLVPCSMRMTLTVESTSLVPWIWVVTVHSRLRKQVANNGNSWEIGVVALERVGGLCSRGTPSWTRPPPPTGRELVCGAMQSQCKGPFFFFCNSPALKHKHLCPQVSQITVTLPSTVCNFSWQIFVQLPFYLVSAVVSRALLDWSQKVWCHVQRDDGLFCCTDASKWLVLKDQFVLSENCLFHGNIRIRWY